MNERKANFKNKKSIIISKKTNFAFDPNPHNILAGKPKRDGISRKLNDLVLGLDISNVNKTRYSNGDGEFYYNTSGWRIVDAVLEQRKDNPILKNPAYIERLRYGLGPYSVYIPESNCNVTNI